MFDDIYRGRSVLVTGHTGFKGSWLSQWLLGLGARGSGFSVGLPSETTHFEILALASKLEHDIRGDLRNAGELNAAFQKVRPEFVFHLAAEAIVSRSLQDPLQAFSTNLMGTVNVLEAIRKTASVKTAVLMTSDKCYENLEWDYGYREDDRLGGKDPYSASKACAEIAISSYARSYFAERGDLRTASARAGNVIGGGDWAPDRIVPDLIRAVGRNEVAPVRNPKATRPWQHVLEPLSGYLLLGAGLATGAERLNAESFNFGPRSETAISVGVLLARVTARWPEVRWQAQPSALNAKEAGLLKLNCDKTLARLGWVPVLRAEEGIDWTVDWYRAWHRSPQTAHEQTLAQIARFESLAEERGLAWASTQNPRS